MILKLTFIIIGPEKGLKFLEFQKKLNGINKISSLLICIKK